MINRNEIQDRVILRLLNSLKGNAQMVIDANDKMMTPEERLAELEIIGQIKQYLLEYNKEVNRDGIGTR